LFFVLRISDVFMHMLLLFKIGPDTMQIQHHRHQPMERYQKHKFQIIPIFC
jgi:hypothetical protein